MECAWATSSPPAADRLRLKEPLQPPWSEEDSPPPPVDILAGGYWLVVCCVLCCVLCCRLSAAVYCATQRVLLCSSAMVLQGSEALPGTKEIERIEGKGGGMKRGRWFFNKRSAATTLAKRVACRATQAQKRRSHLLKSQCDYVSIKLSAGESGLCFGVYFAI